MRQPQLVSPQGMTGSPPETNFEGKRMQILQTTSEFLCDDRSEALMGTFLEIATPLIQRGIPVIPVQPQSLSTVCLTTSSTSRPQT
jgi:hypothetical protein